MAGLHPDPDRSGRDNGFVLYVEGPRDFDTLRSWGRGISSDLGSGIERSAVILGGRQPARAVEHFRDLDGLSGRTGLCVLDRDGVVSATDSRLSEPGLEFFIWPRRHIESYLLVGDAIRRSLRLPASDLRPGQILAEHVPADERALLQLDAKRLLASRGPLSRGLGASLSPGRIARAMRNSELHSDVVALLERVRSGLGLRPCAEVVRTGRVR